MSGRQAGVGVMRTFFQRLHRFACAAGRLTRPFQVLMLHERVAAFTDFFVDDGDFHSHWDRHASALAPARR